MEAFKRIVAYFDIFVEKKLDFIKKLPIEISNMIFGMLDNRSLRSVAKVSHTWRSMSTYERRRRQSRNTKLNLMRYPSIKCNATRIVTFEMNEQNGIAIQQNPSRSRRYLRTSDLKDKRNKASKEYNRSNMRFWIYYNNSTECK